MNRKYMELRKCLSNQIFSLSEEEASSMLQAINTVRTREAVKMPDDLAQIILDALAEQEGGGGHDG